MTEHSGSPTDSGQSTGVAEALPKVAEPPQYSVLLHNDDYTTMEFVVEVLKKFFNKSEDQAVQIMLSVHKKGKGVAGSYTFEVAETKAYQTTEAAREKGFPLKVTVEKME